MLVPFEELREDSLEVIQAAKLKQIQELCMVYNHNGTTSGMLAQQILRILNASSTRMD